MSSDLNNSASLVSKEFKAATPDTQRMSPTEQHYQQTLFKRHHQFHQSHNSMIMGDAHLNGNRVHFIGDGVQGANNSCEGNGAQAAWQNFFHANQLHQQQQQQQQQYHNPEAQQAHMQQPYNSIHAHSFPASNLAMTTNMTNDMNLGHGSHNYSPNICTTTLNAGSPALLHHQHGIGLNMNAGSSAAISSRNATPQPAQLHLDRSFGNAGVPPIPSGLPQLAFHEHVANHGVMVQQQHQMQFQQQLHHFQQPTQQNGSLGQGMDATEGSMGYLFSFYSTNSNMQDAELSALKDRGTISTPQQPRQHHQQQSQQQLLGMMKTHQVEFDQRHDSFSAAFVDFDAAMSSSASASASQSPNPGFQLHRHKLGEAPLLKPLPSTNNESGIRNCKGRKGKKPDRGGKEPQTKKQEKNGAKTISIRENKRKTTISNKPDHECDAESFLEAKCIRHSPILNSNRATLPSCQTNPHSEKNKEISSQTPLHLSCTAGSFNPLSHDSISLKTVTSRRNVGMTPSTMENGVKNPHLPSDGASFVATEDIFEDDLSVEALNSLQCSRKRGITLRGGLDSEHKLFSGMEHETPRQKGMGGHGVEKNTPTFKNDSSSSIEDDNDTKKTKNTVNKKKKLTTESCKNIESTKLANESLPKKPKTATDSGTANPKVKPSSKASTEISHPNRSCGPIELVSCSANDTAIKREKNTTSRKPPSKCNKNMIFGGSTSETLTNSEAATTETNQTTSRLLSTINSRSNVSDTWHRERSRTVTIISGKKLITPVLVRGCEASSNTKSSKVKKDGNKHKDGKRVHVLPTDGRKAKCSNLVVSVDEEPLSNVWNLNKSQSKIKPADVDKLADPECLSTSSKSPPSTFTLAGHPSPKTSVTEHENSHPCPSNSNDNSTQNTEAKTSTDKLRPIGLLIKEGTLKQRDGVASNTNKVECKRQNQETTSIKFKQLNPGEETTFNCPLERRMKIAKFEENRVPYIHTGTDTNSLKNAFHSKSVSSQSKQSIGSQESNCLVAAYTEESVMFEKNCNKSDNNVRREGKVGNASSKSQIKNNYQHKFCKSGIGRGGQLSSSSGCENFRDKTRLARSNPATRQKRLHSAANQATTEIEDYETKYRCSSDSSDVLQPDLQIWLNTDAISNRIKNCMNDSSRDASFTHTDVAKAKNFASEAPTCMPQIDDSARTEKFPVSFLCRTVREKNELKTPLSYPYAPMGQLWLDGALSSKKCAQTDDGKNLDLTLGGTLIGRRWVWDEGYYGDGHLDMGLGRIFQLMNQSSNATSISRPFPIGCTCGADHSSLKESDMKRWNLKTDVATARATRRSERSSSSTRMSNVVSQLADGRLNPHTLITCEDYSWGPEFRFLKNIQTESVQPFSVRVSPDVTFLADLHSHLCDSEIIGFLGGYYSKEEKCIYIQAAFPCKSTSRLDSGHTDVEMDPISQIHAREAIANHGMSVVGWYHSHPTFQPDPSVTDIENQASYQQLFTNDNDSQNLSNTDSNSVIDCYSSSEDDSTHAEEKCPHYRRAGFISPFVGLIVGTYDAKNPSSQSVMRWFHVTSKYTEHGKFVNFPMNLKTTNRHFRKFTDEAKGEKLENVRSDMSEKSVRIRNELESIYLACPLTDFSQLASPENDLATFRKQTLKESQHSTLATNLERQRAERHTTSSGQNHTNVESIEGGDTDLSRNKIIDNNDRSIVSADQQKKTTSPSTEEVKGQTHSIECRGALFLTEELFEIDQKADSSTAKTSQPLFFTEVERTILGLKPDDVSFDVIGGVIWLAVEREQDINFQSSSCQNSVPMAKKNPASSRSILEHLLRHSFSGNDSFDRKIYEMIQCIGESGSAILGEETNVKDSDAAIAHSVDVVLSHYASNGTRFDPFGTWSGAGDKGLISNKDSASTPLESDSWKDYYFTQVLGMHATKLFNGVVEYSGGNKMKRGHKLAACLLKWASFMQLSAGFESSSKQSLQFSYDITRHENGLDFDHERKLIECGNDVLNNTTSQTTGELDYIYFVAEVMRLLAARWREARGTPAKRTRPTPTLPPKRGRPASENPIAQGRKRGRGRPRKVQASSPGNEANIVKRGRGRPRKTENRGPGRPKRSDASGN